VIKEDPVVENLIFDALLSVDKIKEVITALASRLKKFPYLVPFLLKQTQSFIKYEHFEYALRIGKICVGLCPESFECWYTLAESYFHARKFKKVRKYIIYLTVFDHS
jgi:hypothetical protein